MHGIPPILPSSMVILSRVIGVSLYGFSLPPEGLGVRSLRPSKAVVRYAYRVCKRELIEDGLLLQEAGRTATRRPLSLNDRARQGSESEVSVEERRLAWERVRCLFEDPVFVLDGLPLSRRRLYVR